MLKINRLILVGIGICLLIMGVVGCNKIGEMQQELETTPPTSEQTNQPTQNPSPEPEQGGVLKISMRNPKVLNPILNMDKTVDETLKLVFDTLVSFDQNDQVIPSIAESWTVSGEGTVVDIELKDNIKWHDGTPLTANDIVFSLQAIKDAPRSPYKPCVQNIVSFKANTQGSLRILYKEPFSGYAHTLYFPIIPAHIPDVNTNPVGTGPYIIESFTNTKKMNLKYNPNYFKGAPHIHEIEVVVTPDPESDLYAFDQGLIDVVSTDVIDWEKYSKNKESRIHEYMTMHYDYLGVNFNKPVLQSLKLRQALLYAMNRPYLIEKAYLNHGMIADVPVSPISWLYEPQSKQYELDIDEAKRLVEGKPVSIELLVNRENLQRKEVASMLKKMYKDIGINIETAEVDQETYIQRIQGGQYDLFLGGWDLSVIPDLSFAFHSKGVVGGSNYGRYINNEMDQFLQNAFVAKSTEDLKKAYSELQMYLSDELPYISLYFRSAALLTSAKIKGEIKPHHMNIYDNIYEWYVTED